MNLIAELIIRHQDFQSYRSFLLSQKELGQGWKTHQHHIIPKSFGGGEGAGNLIRLSVLNHLQAHKLLCLGLKKLGTYKQRKQMAGAVRLLRKH